MDVKDSVPPEESPPPLLADQCLDSSAIEYLDASVAKTMHSLVAQSRARILRDEVDRNALYAAEVLAPSPAGFSVGKPSTKIDINFFHASTGHVNELLMRETAKQQSVRLTGALLPCVGGLEAKGRKAPVPRFGIPRAVVPFGRFTSTYAGR